MKITLVTHNSINDYGLRTISSCLKKEGHTTNLIFLKSWSDLIASKLNFEFKHHPKLLEDIEKVAKNSDLFGISLMSIHFESSVQLTDYVKKNLEIPVIWGGIHPTVRPDESLNYADIVCIGEGEEVLVDLVNNFNDPNKLKETKNLWFKEDNKIKRNPIRPLLEDLDSLPYPDYSLEGNYVSSDHFVKKAGLLKVDNEILTSVSPRFLDKDGAELISYRTMYTRGCPNNCHYCSNNALRKIYRDKGKYLRRRSIENVLTELKQIIEKFRFIQHITFMDDNFLFTTTEGIKEFSKKYGEVIGLPFSCTASPLTYREPKLRSLIEAGLVQVSMGIQSGCEHVRKDIYNRRETNERILNVVKSMNRLNKETNLRLAYHFILDNPFESEEETIESLQLLSKIPRPYDLCLYSLIFLPGTKLNEDAKREGIVKDEHLDVYRKDLGMLEPNYMNFIFKLYAWKKIPLPILRLLSKKSIINIFNNDLTNYMIKKREERKLKNRFETYLKTRSNVEFEEKTVHPF